MTTFKKDDTAKNKLKTRIDDLWETTESVDEDERLLRWCKEILNLDEANALKVVESLDKPVGPDEAFDLTVEFLSIS